MIIEARVLFKIVFMIILALTVYTGATSSDMFDSQVIEGNRFSTTTLDFSQQDTANNQPVSVLFNVTAIIPDGFRVEGVRVKNDGKMGFKYKVKTLQTSGDESLCSALQLTVLQEWQIKYQGNLLDFSYDSDLSSQKIDDFIYYLKLTSSSDSLKNKSCDFNFVFRSWKVYPDETGGFFDQEILTNHISSGTWVVN